MSRRDKPIDKLDDLEAYDLIDAVLRLHDELGPRHVRMLCVWALGKAELADNLRDELDGEIRRRVIEDRGDYLRDMRKHDL